MTTKNGSIRRATWTALPLGLVLVGALSLSPVLAQDAASDASTEAAAEATAPDTGRRAGAFFARRGPDGAAAMGGRRDAARAHLGANGEARSGDAFARWLEADGDAGPIVPGLVGRLADGTSVRLVFFDGAPEDGGIELADLTYVAGEADATAFRDEVRTAADGATHVVVDVLGRVVTLPEAVPAEAAE